MLGRVFSIILLSTTLGILAPAEVITAQNQSHFQKRIPIANLAGNEEYPDIAYCPGVDAFLVVYDNDYIITGQRLDGTGSPVGDPFQISSPSSGGGLAPVAACAEGASSYFVVTWMADGDFDDIQVQAVHASAQAEPASQLFGAPITVGDPDNPDMYPRLACSNIDLHCLLLRIDISAGFVITAQRLAMTESGIALLGDEFTFPADISPDLSSTVSWNSLDKNYLVVWQRNTDIINQYDITYTHVYEEEQGPGMNEMQHEPVLLFVPDEDTRTCHYPLTSYNSQTGKFMVVFSCDEISSADDPEIIIQRVDGTGTGLQGGPVRFTDMGAIHGPYMIAGDIWSIKESNGDSQYMIAALTWQSSPTHNEWLYLLPIKGVYDPSSPDQLDGEVMLLKEAGYLYPSGTSNTSNGRSILTVEEGSFYGPNDIYGYLFPPFLYHLPLIYKD
jgi:hypothetical protein